MGHGISFLSLSQSNPNSLPNSIQSEQLLFRPSLIQATRDNIEQAKLFITASNVQPDHGGTGIVLFWIVFASYPLDYYPIQSYFSQPPADIYSPLSWAIELLQRDTAPNSLTLPFVFLFTDGCVEHERYCMCWKLNWIGLDWMGWMLVIMSQAVWFVWSVLL